MAFPSFTSSEACPIVIDKTTLLTGGIWSNQAMKVGYSVPAAGVSTGFPVTAIFSFDIGAGCTVADATVVYLYAAWETAPAGDSRMLRFEDNGTYPPNSFIEVSTASGAKGPGWFIHFNQTLSNCHNIAGALTSQSGFITVDCSGTTRYIPLYSA